VKLLARNTLQPAIHSDAGSGAGAQYPSPARRIADTGAGSGAGFATSPSRVQHRWLYLRPVTDSQVPYTADLELAMRAAGHADEITIGRFRAVDLHVETKPDLTPVSDADREVERMLRALLSKERPTDSMLGEEYGVTGDSRRQWIVDPIDGTKNFVRGVPVWATLIALSSDGEIVVAVVSAPAMGRRWWATRGSGAWTSDVDGAVRKLTVSGVADIRDGFLSFSGVGQWARIGRLRGFLALTESVWRTRAFGDFWSHLLVAEGAVDLACEPEVELYDVATVSLIVTEAGGRFTSLSGTPRPDQGSAISTNGLLHDETLRLLDLRD
jgi:histidinol-phosphatase